MKKAVKKFNSSQHLSSYVNVYNLSFLEKESEIEKGLNLTRLKSLALNMELSTDVLINMLGLSEFTPTLEIDDKEVFKGGFKESFKESFKGSFKESLCANPPISPNDFKIIWPATLSKKSSAIILQLESLIGQTVERIGESGNPGGFNAATWMVDWINSPNQTLVGRRPAQYLNTLKGQKIVSDILAKAQLGS